MIKIHLQLFAINLQNIDIFPEFIGQSRGAGKKT